MMIGEICNRDVVIVQREEPVVIAAKLMRRHHVGTVVAVYDRDGQRVPVGMLTDRDIVIEVIAEDVNVATVNIGDIMSRDMWTANVSDDVADVLKMMQRKGVRRVPVVNDSGGLEGIVSVDDLLDLLSDQLSDLGALIGRELNKEAETRDPSLIGNSTIQ